MGNEKGNVELNPRIQNPDYGCKHTPWKSIVRKGNVESVYLGIRREDVEMKSIGQDIEDLVEGVVLDTRNSFADSAPVKSFSKRSGSARPDKRLVYVAATSGNTAATGGAGD